jgi:hypothetical protein
VNEEWHLRGAAALRSEYAELASIAARKLGYAPGEDAYKNWLGRVWKWMQEGGLDRDETLVWCPTGSVTERGSTGTTKHLFTQSIAELSAMFCLKLFAQGVPDWPPSSPDRVGETSHESAALRAGNAGRKLKREPRFYALAGRLWREERAQSSRVRPDGLMRIAKQLEAAGFEKPSDYLEGEAAKNLNKHNRDFGASAAKKIMTWTALVEKGDQEQIRAMTRLLSRCAGKLAGSISGQK